MTRIYTSARNLIAFAVLALVALTAPAFALDIGPLVDQIVGPGGLLGLILTGIAAWVGVWIKNWLAARSTLVSSQTAESLQARYNEACRWAIALMESKAGGVIPRDISLGNPLLEMGAEFMLKSWPDLTKGKLVQDIATSLLARLPSGPETERANAAAVKALPVPIALPVAVDPIAVAPSQEDATAATRRPPRTRPAP